jgi:hypothetical protein
LNTCYSLIQEVIDLRSSLCSSGEQEEAKSPENSDIFKKDTSPISSKSGLQTEVNDESIADINRILSPFDTPHTKLDRSEHQFTEICVNQIDLDMEISDFLE